MARGFYFLLRRDWAILRPAVPLAMVTAVGLVACRCPGRGKESRQAVVASVSFAARSSPGSDRSFAVGLSDSLIGLVPADLVIVSDLFAAAGPDLVVAADSAVAAVVVGLCLFVAGPACPACPVCLVYSDRSFDAATGKGRADLVSYSLVLRFSFLRSRNCLLPLYFEDQASGFAGNDRAHLSSHSAFCRRPFVLRRADRVCCRGYNALCFADRYSARAVPG